MQRNQYLILDTVRKYVRTYGIPPTVREICAETGITSTSVVNYNLKQLAESGYIARGESKARSIKLLDAPGDKVISVPFLGRIAAGKPLSIPDSDFAPFTGEYLPVSQSLLPERDDLYALEVHGNSMIDALIGDGDLVIIRHQNQVENGAMAAVWLKEERATTLKHFYLEGEMVRLQPANPYMSPIYVNADDIEIQGTVVMVLRKTHEPALLSG